MLSINIPVFNVEINSLVSQLIKQAKKLDLPFEIRVYDDASDMSIKLSNRVVNRFSNVIYLELDKNIGRAKIRNKMGFDSKFKYLLFIDADSKLINKNYLESFMEEIESNRVLCGGTAYSQEKPLESKKLLRWVYGTNREAVSAKIRNSKKGFIITSNNFLIEKSIFKKISFRADLKKYGHEDTLLGYDLFNNEIEIFHINNPVEHTGLEDSKLFLEKTKIALKNLFFISNGLLSKEQVFNEQVYFLNKYLKITKYLPAMLLRAFYKMSHRCLQRNLLGKRPSLFLFDLYKIAFYSTLK